MHATAPVAVLTWLSCDKKSAGPRKPICTYKPNMDDVHNRTGRAAHRCRSCHAQTRKVYTHLPSLEVTIMWQIADDDICPPSA